MKKEKRKDLLAKIVLSAYSIPIILGINLVKNELLGKPNDNNLILYQNENMLIKKTY